MKLLSDLQIEKQKIYGAWTRHIIALSIVLIASAAILLLEMRYKREYIFFIGTTLLSMQLLQARRWLRSAFIFSVGFAAAGYYRPLANFISKLGADSFAEAKNFEIEEAKFWFTTVSNSIHQEFDFAKLSVVFIFSVGCFYFARWFSSKTIFPEKNSARVIFYVAATAMVLTLHQAVYDSVSLFVKNSNSILELEKNFKSVSPNIIYDEKKINLVVYIGESTSIMNMGIYGYPRDTTPKLSGMNRSDPNLLVFENALSTHVHTTPSLLEALSFGVNEEEKNLPIDKRRRISVADILVKGGIDTTLFSNQGTTGTWNHASAVVFAKTNRNFSTNSRLGNNETEVEVYRPWDHEFLVTSLERYLSSQHAGSKRTVFLHSYAGHGLYLANIPEAFRHPVDDLFVRKNGKYAIADDTGLMKGVDEYDSAMRYVDFALSEAIRVVKNSQEATILLYFADHGDAAYVGRGHDSARFIHEMVRVPLLLYFNDAAKSTNAELYEKYKLLASKKNISTLAQIPSTLLDLLGVQLIGGAPVVKTKIIGEATEHPLIFLREMVEGITFLNINKFSPKLGAIFDKKFIDKSDDDTKIFVVTKNKKSQSTKTCYRRSNDIGRVLRGGLVADCLEIDLDIEPGGGLNVYGVAAKKANFGLNDVIEVASKRNMALWMGGGNINERKNCQSLFNFLDGKKYDNRILVEFPPGTYNNKSELNGCVTALRNDKYAISYSVPGSDLIPCSQALANGRIFESEKSCLILKKDIQLASDSGLFSDFSFDYAGIKAMENIGAAKKLHWNIRNVSPDSFDKIGFERFGMVILGVSDPGNP